MAIDSFFELRIQVFSEETPYFTHGPLNCGPYISYAEAVNVMMDGISVVLIPYMQAINGLTEPHVHSQILECAIIDKQKEVLNVKCEEFRSIS